MKGPRRPRRSNSLTPSTTSPQSPCSPRGESLSNAAPNRTQRTPLPLDQCRRRARRRGHVYCLLRACVEIGKIMGASMNKKLGPFKVWQWGLLGGGAFLAYYLYTKNKSATKTEEV